VLDVDGQPKTRLQAYLDRQIDYLEPRGFAISDIERAILHLQEIAEPIFFAELHHEAAAYRKALWVLNAGVKRLALEFSEHYNQRMMNNYYEEVSKMLHRIKNKITPAQSGLQTILPQEFYGRAQEGMLITGAEGLALDGFLTPLVSFVQFADQVLAKLDGASLDDAARELTAARDAFAASEEAIQAALGKLAMIEIVEEFIRDALEAAELSTALAKDLQEVQNELIRREPPIWESICINELVQRAFDESQVDAKLKGLEYALSADDEHAHVFGVARQLAQPFAQVINNAIKYTPASASSINGDTPESDGREHRVTVALTIEEDSILFACQDSGIGIPSGEEELVFALCERCSNAKEFNKHGSGTGLYQDRKIIEQHNGRIWLESAGQNQGSTFYIRLPRYHGEMEEAAAAR
jgi:signal transduction histidine kinase